MKLPLILTDTSEWHELRAQGALIVDKTAQLRKIVDAYFGGGAELAFSRPDGFGKSLLCSMLEEIFTKGDQAFAGTDVHGNWCLPKAGYKVIRIQFRGPRCQDPAQFESELAFLVMEAFRRVGFAAEIEALRASDHRSLYETLREIQSFAYQCELVFLVDNWDYPLQSLLHDEANFKAVRRLIETFYNWAASFQATRYILFCGVMRFDGLRVIDLTDSPYVATLLGFSRDEIKTYFAAHLIEAARRLNLSESELLDQLEYHYGGYRFCGRNGTKLHCPWSICRFFKQLEHEGPPLFDHFWIKRNRGQATKRLLTLLRRYHLSQEDFEEITTNRYYLNTDYDLTEPKLFTPNPRAPLLALEGYISLKHYRGRYGFPNEETCAGFTHVFEQYLNDGALLQEIVADLYHEFSIVLNRPSGFASGTLHALLEQHIKEHDPNTRVVKLDLSQIHATTPEQLEAQICSSLCHALVAAGFDQVAQYAHIPIMNKLSIVLAGRCIDQPHAYLIDNWDAPLSEPNTDRAAMYDAMQGFLTWLDNNGTRAHFILVTGRTDPCFHDLINPSNHEPLGRIFRVQELFDLLQ